jgi:hypothetical protein
MAHSDVASRRSSFVSAWFVLDAILALFPPIYWAAGGAKPIVLGLPCSVVYFIGTGIVITASLAAAYWDDERRGAFDRL